jgi:hypothetical protein
MNQYSPTRRRALRTAMHLSGACLAGLILPSIAATPLTGVTVWKSPTCGCCNDWIQHLQDNGFKVEAVNVPDSRHVRSKFGMPAKFASCHTGLIGGYVVEGHVPAREIRKLLREKPAALGISVPAMPLGSPGMDGPSYRGMRDPYDVLLVQRDGTARVYASYA